MNFDLTISVGDLLVIIGSVISLGASSVVMLYRICKRLDRIEAMAEAAAARSGALDLHAVATLAAATGAAVARPPGGEKSD